MNDEEFKASVIEWCKEGMVLESNIRKIYEKSYDGVGFEGHLYECRKHSIIRMNMLVDVMNDVSYEGVLGLLPTYHPTCLYARNKLGGEE